MDIYRFFHPHHSPRLHSTPVRLQELLELLQAASELRKAVERAQTRTRRAPTPPLLPGHFNEIVKALQFVENSLETLSDAHSGDSSKEIGELVNERLGIKGWENWVALVREQLMYNWAEMSMDDEENIKFEDLGLTVDTNSEDDDLKASLKSKKRNAA